MTVRGDLVGGLLALVCAVHCLAMPLLLSVATFSTWYWFAGTDIEWVLIVSSVAVSGATLAVGWEYRHGKSLPAKIAMLGFTLFWLAQAVEVGDNHYTLSALAGGLIALAHLWNDVLNRDTNLRLPISGRSPVYLFSVLMLCMFVYVWTLQGVMTPGAPNTKQELLQHVWQVQPVSAN